MNLSKFVNRDIWAFLRTFRPLLGWEQLHIFYHSSRPLRVKRAAYETLLTEFYGDHELKKHLRRSIQKADEALNAPNRESKPGCFFRARSDIYELDEQGMIKGVYDGDKEGFFSTYCKAKRWLDRQRRDAQEYAPLYCNQRIMEITLDSNREINGWYFDDQGIVCAFDDAALKKQKSAKATPEGRYVHLPGVFAPGEILFLRPDHKWQNGTYLAVAPHGYFSQSEGADDGDMAVFVMEYDPESETTGHDHWPLWNTERFTGKLPESQRALYDISRHFKGEKLLGEADIQRLDPIGFFYWDKVGDGEI